ncbi:TonB-dependent receptor [Pseudoflavitalea sp. X16]|uniref:TonB-dependent receptor domain-containing protein n=1 Tax=Paraflavitalea devenefica TaxID=2716334 RepID=UPI00141F0891|nr:TonB-dependent receptor [Paraflavitalea devenefica]NII24749.1 TonB-dependent receptor [Paraflavitalea devenefica]
MRSIAGLILFTLCLFSQLQAQRTRYANLKGTVIDSASRQPVEAATVSIFLVADSTLINYGITNKKGEFLIKEIPQAKPCRVMVSYSGLNTHIQDFIISPETKELIINTVQLRKVFSEMEEIIVSAQRPPVMIKKDTLEFNAGSFKTPVNGVVEDLLKQLPGVEVDAEGNITINGKKVSKITVDGKDFFGSDFKITSKNLPKDIIDKVQVVDHKTREAQFNKITTGNEDKAINLTLKKDKKKGLFGRVSTGYGSDKRYESGASINFFNGPLQLNFIGFANNTNRQSFSGGDFSMGKPSSSFGGGGSGITETRAAGLNFSNEFSKKLRINGSYFYNNSAMTNTIKARRQNILPDTTFFYNSSTNSANNNESHRVHVNIDYKPDSMTDIYVNTFFNTSANKSTTANDALSTSIKGDPINAATNTFTGRSDDKNTGLEVFFGHRLNKQGRGFTLSMNYNYNDRLALDKNDGRTVFYKTDGSSTADTLDQQSNTTASNNMLSLSTSWTEPLAKQLSLIFQYNYSSGNGHSDKITNRFNPLTGQYDERDTLFSNAFRNRNLSHTPNISFSYNQNKLNATIGAGVQWLEQENVSEQAKNSLVQHYTNLFPSANIGYRFSKTGNINLNYSGRSQQPSIDQLQPVPDNSNTLYIRLGNPDLKPSFFHNINLNLQQYNSKAYWNAGIGFSTVNNQIIYETWFDSVQISRPVNTDGNYNVSYNLSFSRSWKKKGWSLRLTLGNNGYYNRNISFTNKVENITQTYNLSQRIGLTYTFKELLTLMPTFIMRYSDSRYSIEQTQQAENITKALTMNAFLNWPKRLILENNIQYNYNSRTAPGFPKGVTMWNMAANYQLFKNRQGILRLAVYDLLKQNTSIFRSVTPTYIEDTQVQVLQQYFLVSFIYNLKRFGK